MSAQVIDLARRRRDEPQPAQHPEGHPLAAAALILRRVAGDDEDDNESPAGFPRRGA